ncbi:hypothetical protein HZH68_010022 [Vespula germanica]|uniref:Uncharacterized protein n=1 Tax=Vespula germanica TaxID=30212 RepID=A0A834N4I1_VESGE|nr:hypothetical protein HZH68_010022 [Vespula germanica]
MGSLCASVCCTYERERKKERRGERDRNRGREREREMVGEVLDLSIHGWYQDNLALSQAIDDRAHFSAK